MRESFCPDCDTGWRYADEVAQTESTKHRHGLVRCPTCHGTGRVQHPDRPPVAVATRTGAAAE